MQRWILAISFFFVLACERTPVAKPPSRVPAAEESPLTTCKNFQRRHESSRCDYDLSTEGGVKTIHVIKLSGAPRQIAYDNGYLMAKEIEKGFLKTHRKILQKRAETHSPTLQALYKCYATQIQKSMDRTALAFVSLFYRGYSDFLLSRGIDPQFNTEQILTSLLAFEIAATTESLSYRIERDNKLAEEIGPSCQMRMPASDLVKDLDENRSEPLKFAEGTGFSLTQGFKTPHAVLHAHTLDSDWVDWNQNLTLYLVDQPGKAKFVSSGSAGLSLPGALGGMNEYGITVSLYQIAGSQSTPEVASGTALIAPLLTQTILEEAKSLDQAIALAQKTPHFSAWSLLVSDAKSGESAIIEMSAEKTNVAKRAKNALLVQSSHFLSPAMKDAFYHHNFNQLLSSRSRAGYLQRQLTKFNKRHPANIDEAMSLLGSHKEYLTSPPPPFNAERAFGRTPVTPRSRMSVIMSPLNNEYWMTLGDKNPAPHSHYVGLQVDFKKGTFYPFAQKDFTDYQKQIHWEQSLDKFVEARQAYTTYADNSPSLALEKINEAIQLAQKDNRDELSYFFMRARLRHQLGAQKIGLEREQYLQGALDDWGYLWDKRRQMHPYGLSLVALYTIAAMDELDPSLAPKNPDPLNSSRTPQAVRLNNKRQEKWSFAQKGLTALAQKSPHFDLDKKLAILKKLEKPKRGVELPPLDFVSIEN